MGNDIWKHILELEKGFKKEEDIISIFSWKNNFLKIWKELC